MNLFPQNPRIFGWFAVAVSLAFGLTAVAYQTPREGKPVKAIASPDEKAIRDSGQAFVDAFNKGDAKALAQQWTESGEYRNENGVVLKGRGVIEKTYESWLASHAKPTISIKIETVRFISKDAAWVEGTLGFQGNPQGPPETSKFKTLRVREDGKWLIAESIEQGSSEASLGELAWLLGSWRASSKDLEAEINVSPWLGQGFYKADFKIHRKDEPVLEGSQIIGKDPRNSGLRSWIFETRGGSGDGVWVYDGQKWELEIEGFAGAGVPYQSVQVFSPINKDAFLWQSIERFVAGVRLPDTTPLKLQRLK